MKCNNCGKEIKKGQTFCPSCGIVTNNLIKINKNNPNIKYIIITVLMAILLLITIISFIIFQNQGQIVNMNGIKVYVPNTYEEEIKDGYNKSFISKQEDVRIATITETNYNITHDEYIKMFESIAKQSSSYKCEKQFTKNIKKTKWTKYTCTTKKAKANLYITVKKEKIYIVSLESLKTKNIKLIEKRLENSLELIK